MGLLKKLNIVILILFIAGCGPTSIKLNTFVDEDAYSMFGKIPQREFYIPAEIEDSVSERWEGSVNGNFTNSSAAVSDSFVFINDLSGRITVFRTDNGKRVGQLKNEGSVFTTPVIHKLLVIYADAFNSENKTDLVFYDFSRAVFANVATVPGRILTQLLKTNDGIIGLTETGIAVKYSFGASLVWETETGVFTHSSPAMSKGIVVFGNDKGELIAINEKSGDVLYRKKLTNIFSGSPTISGDIAYIGTDSGELLAVNIENGNIVWSFDSGARIIANPVTTTDKIVCTNLRGDIYMLNLYNGTELWKQNTGGVIHAAPFVTGNRVIVPDLSGKVSFISSADGEIVKTLEFPARVRLSPVIFGNSLYIGYDKGILKSYEIFYKH